MFKKTEKVPAAPDLEYFTIYDTKVGVYRKPMLAINQYDVLRQLDQFFRDEQNHKDQLVANAEDFQLFSIGNFTAVTGQIDSWEPRHIANLHEIRTAAFRALSQINTERKQNMGIVPT